MIQWWCVYLVTSFVLNNPINRINDLINIYFLIIALFIYRFFLSWFQYLCLWYCSWSMSFFCRSISGSKRNKQRRKKFFFKKNEKSLRKKRLMQNYLHELDIVNVTKKWPKQVLLLFFSWNKLSCLKTER